MVEVERNVLKLFISSFMKVFASCQKKKSFVTMRSIKYINYKGILPIHPGMQRFCNFVFPT